MTGKPRDPHALTPEEKKLWALVTQGDRPLRRQKKGNNPSPWKGEGRVGVQTQQKKSIDEGRADPLLDPPPSRGRKKIGIGNYAGIDRNTAERFRKGHYPIDATLDLHGMTAQKAQAALVRFVSAHYARQSRCLLVITGKGTKGEGVLKKALPGWLAHEDVAPMILAFDAAKTRHGGSGACYVLLRRKRHV